MNTHTQSEMAPQGTPADPLITVIVPTRNEAGNIRPLLARLAPVLTELGGEVLFVDDSSDDTPAVVTGCQDDFTFVVRLLARPPERRNGLSGAVVDGMRAARGAWLCVMDADLQHPPEVIPRLWAQAQMTGADMVVGSRKGDVMGPQGLSRSRSLTSKSLTVLARMLFPRLLKNVSDPLTGLFLVRRTAVDPDLLHPDGFKILLEILVRCPDLHVTELHFDFAPRHDGQSKADIQEGMRFFRHVVRLRVTVNPHLLRFLVVVTLGIAGNLALLVALVAGAGWNYLLGAAVAAELMALWDFFWFERWVFSERERRGWQRRFWARFIFTQVLLVGIYLPLLYLLVTRGGVNYVLAQLVAILVVSLVRYGLSEQWIWTTGSMAWQLDTHYYDIHGIVRVASQVALPDLAHFVTAVPLEPVDLHVRLDRQGTPSRLPGGISYDEHLGRFGFGLTVMPGDYTEVVVSPLLKRSPGFLFTNIVEPVLRWSFVRKGYALVKAAGAAAGGRAVLLHADADMGQAMSRLCATHEYAFMGDDLTILSRDGYVYSYPKPVTVAREMVRTGSGWLRLGERLALGGRRLIYSRAVRRLGLWLSDRELPAATLNTYLQALVPQPKFLLDEVLPGMTVAARARVTSLVVIGPQADTRLALGQVVAALQRWSDGGGFQPNPLLRERLSRWQGVDLMKLEREIIAAALQDCALRQIEYAGGTWWQNFPQLTISARQSLLEGWAGERPFPTPAKHPNEPKIL